MAQRHDRLEDHMKLIEIPAGDDTLVGTTPGTPDAERDAFNRIEGAIWALCALGYEVADCEIGEWAILDKKDSETSDESIEVRIAASSATPAPSAR